MYRQALFRLVLLFFFVLCARDSSGAVSIKQRQDCEVLTTKGLLLAQREGRELWLKAIEIWPACYLAHEALGLSLLQSREFEEALNRLEMAQRTAPPFRRKFYDFHKARAHFELGHTEEAAGLLENFLDVEKFYGITKPEEGLLAQAQYLWGLIDYRNQDHSEALKHFEEALELLGPEDQDLAQSLHYYMGEIYARFHMRKRSIIHLRQAEVGPSSSLRRTAWFVHAHLNEWSWAGKAGLFLRHDSNPVLVSAGEPLPPELEAQSNQGVEPFASLQLESSYAKNFGVGAAVSSRAVVPLTNQFAFANSLEITPSFWGRYWDRDSFEARLGYSFHHTRLGRRFGGVLENFNEAKFSFSLFPRETRLRWSLEMGAGVREYPLEAVTKRTANDRGGPIYTAHTRVGWESGTWFEPFAGSGFSYVTAWGDEFKQYSYVAELGAQSSPFERFSFSMLAAVQRSKFFSSTMNRLDYALLFNASLGYKLTDNTGLLVDSSVRHAMSNVTTYSYDQILARLGLEFLF